MKITVWQFLSWYALAGFGGFVLGRVWLELRRFLAALWRHHNEQQSHSQAFCPGCKTDLVSSASEYWDDGLIYYTCSRCHTQSRWDFYPPAPVLLASNYVQPTPPT
jgi:hypothetical protein